ncbi:MAG TPA: hypothetical protein VGY76_00645 [Solirubrobacteraceae bacterium]|jgi:hypothetical protein|nr:hypothetical protein [Solirubrobacteraceae bacterium]
MRMPLLTVWLFFGLAACALARSAPAALATEGACPNEALRLEQASGRLPDCRAYELVTPPYKEGSPVKGLQDEFALSGDGNRLIATSLGVFAGAEEGGLNPSSRLYGTAYELSRTATGWQPLALGPPASRYVDAGMYDASADLSSTLWGLGTLAQPEGLSDFYLERPRGTFVEIGPPTPPASPSPSPSAPEPPNAGKYSYLGAAADLSHVLFSTQPGYRWPFDATSETASTLYEYVGTGNSTPALVGVSGGAGSTELVSRCGTLLGSGGAGSVGGSMYNAVSATGNRVFFTAIGADDQACGAQQPPVDELLAREEAPGGQLRTVVLSEPSLGHCAANPVPACTDAHFEGASQDGSKVLFSSAQQLLPAADEGTANLYEYDFQAPAGENLVLASAGGAHAEVQGLARLSEDGSHLYFVAKGVLSAAANSAGAAAVAGAQNLYLYERDAQFPGGRTVFIATLSPGDEADWARADKRPVLASQNGRYLVFLSRGDLLGEGLAAGVAQVFQYDAQTGILARVSSGEAGFNEDGRKPLHDATLAAQQADTFDSPTAAVGMSAPENGAVFFASPTALTPQALNEQINAFGAPVPNIYEYRAGSVQLISSGHDVSTLNGSPGVQLLGSDPSGADVFFTTVDSLVAQDTDTQQDIYDARSVGGFPATMPIGSCIGEACQGPPSPSQPSTQFGITHFATRALDAGEAPDTTAGGHPHSLTTSFDFTLAEPVAGATGLRPSENVKDVLLDLPQGFAINALAAPRCQLHQLQASGVEQNECPAASRIGTLGLRLSGEAPGQLEAATTGLYNMVPEAGYPFEFGAVYFGHPIHIYGSLVRTGSGYELRLTVPGVSGPGLIGASLTLFGDPSTRAGNPGEAEPFLINPVDCAAAPLPARLEVDTWQHPGQYKAAEAVTYEALRECDALKFEPTLTVTPEVSQADEPSGYLMQILAPQVENPRLPATPPLKNATVTLPVGVSLAPPAADGLVGCPATGAQGINLGSGEVSPQGQDLGDPEASELGPDGLYRTAPGHCPPAATVGTVEIDTPLLAVPLEGHVYLAQPQCGGEAQLPCSQADAPAGRLFGVYLEAAGSGVLLKLAGRLAADLATGQLTLSLQDLPQLPISRMRLWLKGGPHALLANPQLCGVAGASSDLSPWSWPATADALPSSAFSIYWTGTGGACPGTLPFGPSMSANETSSGAASFTALTLSIARADREQDLARIGVQLPPGLTWQFSHVPLCSEPQAAAGTCFDASDIGATRISLGAGAQPYWLSGRVYLSGSYRGAAYGLSIVVKMLAGPFNLGTVIVRAAVAVDPSTGALKITTDPLPQIIAGVALRIGTIDLTIDRPEFVLNPTYCAARQISASIEGLQGANAELSDPFVTPGCQNPPTPTGQASLGPSQGAVGGSSSATVPKPKKAVKAKHGHRRHKRKRSKRKHKPGNRKHKYGKAVHGSAGKRSAKHGR